MGWVSWQEQLWNSSRTEDAFSCISPPLQKIGWELLWGWTEASTCSTRIPGLWGSKRRGLQKFVGFAPHTSPLQPQTQ